MAFPLGAILSAVGGSIGDIGGAFLQDHFNRASAKRQMQFQEDMSSSAYQRAAVDLEKAGLNRVLAVGNPASSPAGAALPTSVPALGQSLTNARVASANIDNVKAQTELTKVNTAKAAAEAAFVQQQTTQSVAETAFKNFLLKSGEGKLPYEINELFSRSGMQESSARFTGELFRSQKELTRLHGVSADKAEVERMFYRMAAPLLEPLVKKGIKEISSGLNSAKNGTFMDYASDFLMRELYQGMGGPILENLLRGTGQPTPGSRAMPRSSNSHSRPNPRGR